MEAVSKLVETLAKLWPNGALIGLALLACFAFIHFARQFQDIRAATISVKEKQFDQLSMLIQDKELIKKPGLLLELAFEKYFGFILSADEIHHLLKSKNQLLAIRDLKYCRGMFKFENNEYIHSQYPDLDKQIKMLLRTCWYGSILGLISIGYALVYFSSLDKISWETLFLSITVVVNWYGTFDELHSLRAAQRIALKEYGPEAV